MEYSWKALEKNGATKVEPAPVSDTFPLTPPEPEDSVGVGIISGVGLAAGEAEGLAAAVGEADGLAAACVGLGLGLLAEALGEGLAAEGLGLLAPALAEGLGLLVPCVGVLFWEPQAAVKRTMKLNTTPIRERRLYKPANILPPYVISAWEIRLPLPTPNLQANINGEIKIT